MDGDSVMWRLDQETLAMDRQNIALSSEGLLKSSTGGRNNDVRRPRVAMPRLEGNERCSWSRSVCWSVSAALAVLLVVDATWHLRSEISVKLKPLDYSRPSGLRIADCTCGSSTQEALAMNCTFDQLAAAWLPPECRDEELTDGFSRAGPGLDGAWTYYADVKGERVLNLTEVSLLADTGEHLYATEGWHLMHCNYSWRKQLRAPATGTTIEDRYYRIEHVEHCGMMLGEAFAVDPDAIAVSARVLLNSSFAEHKRPTINKLEKTRPTQLSGNIS